MSQEFSRLDVGSTQGLNGLNIENYFLMNCACTGFFIGFLLLLSWWYGPSSFEQRFGPVEAANEERDSAIEERDAAIKERDDALRASAEMGTKHERAMETILELQDESSKNFQDLPWLTQRNFELAEENIVQYNEIQSLKLVQRRFDDLVDDVSTYGMTAKPPEQYQQMCESLQRKLETSDYHLGKSEKDVRYLSERLQAQKNAANKEKAWLQAQLKKNSRSTAYWAKFRRTRTPEESKPRWGVRCACTEPEIAYALKDQTPRIVELEATVEARDRTIMRLRTSRGNVLKNDASSVSNAAKAYLPSTEDSVSNTITGSRTPQTTFVHACDHEQQCRHLQKKVEDNAKTMRQLRIECQVLRDAAPNESTADAAETDAKVKLEEELAAKDVVIRELREEKTKIGAGLAAKDTEIEILRGEKRLADETAAATISKLEQGLTDAHQIAAQREQELGRQKTKIGELEATQSGLKNAIAQKDLEIEDLENANQEMAQQPAPESAETLQRLSTANSSLDELRRQHAGFKAQSETQSARISELEAAGRELQATTKLKDDAIAGLEEQISQAPTIDIIESQTQSHKQAIEQKNQEYQTLQDLYTQAVEQQQLSEVKCNENAVALKIAQQNDNAKLLELQRLWTEFTNFRNTHAHCDGRLNDLANQLRQGGNAYTDLQVKYNTQATELETANQNAGELRSNIASLQQANATLQQTNTSSESGAEKYRLEGENRVRPIWQATLDREMSAQIQKLEASQGAVFKLENQLQQAKNQANPLREMQLRTREDAVKAREEALEKNTDAMEHDQQGSSTAEQKEIKALEAQLAAANKEAGDARLRRSGMERQLNKERKERKEEKERHEREMKREREDFAKRSEIQTLRLEKENPLKGTVSKLQNEVARLEKELKERS